MTINWIPSHRGIGYNEDSDQQADLGQVSEASVRIPYTRQWLKKTLYNVRDCQFAQHLRENVKQSQLCTQYPDRSMFVEPRTKSNSSRAYGGESLFHIQTGHTFLRSHQFLVNAKVKDNECSWCNESEETPEHVLLQCNGLTGMQELRTKLVAAMESLTFREAVAKDDLYINEILLTLILKLRSKKVWI